MAQPAPRRCCTPRMKVEEIAEAIAKLPPDQLARFRRWFAAFEVGRSDHAKETARSGRSCLAARDWTIVIPPQAIAGNDHTEASKLLLTGSPKFALARRLPMGENRDCYWLGFVRFCVMREDRKRANLSRAEGERGSSRDVRL